MSGHVQPQNCATEEELWGQMLLVCFGAISEDAAFRVRGDRCVEIATDVVSSTPAGRSALCKALLDLPGARAVAGTPRLLRARSCRPPRRP